MVMEGPIGRFIVPEGMNGPRRRCMVSGGRCMMMDDLKRQCMGMDDCRRACKVAGSDGR